MNGFRSRKATSCRRRKARFERHLGQGGMHLAVPLLATLGTAPLIAHYFGHLSLAGFVANPLIVPLVGFVVVPSGLGIGFLPVIAPELGAICRWCCGEAVVPHDWMVDIFAHLPLANFAVPSPECSGSRAALYDCFSAPSRSGKGIHLGALLALALIALGTSGAYWWGERQQRQELRVTHLNVGQGDAAVVELPGSKVFLIDAGGTATAISTRAKESLRRICARERFSRSIISVVTHPRIDHYGGMRTIVNEFSPREFWSGAGERPNQPLRGFGGNVGTIANHPRGLHDGEAVPSSSAGQDLRSYPPR